jgi:hypothetical protein
MTSWVFEMHLSSFIILHASLKPFSVDMLALCNLMNEFLLGEISWEHAWSSNH